MPLEFHVEDSIHELATQQRISFRRLDIRLRPGFSMEHPQALFENSDGLSLQLLSHVEATHCTFGLIHEAKPTSQGFPDRGGTAVLFRLQSTYRFGCCSIHRHE